MSIFPTKILLATDGSEDADLALRAAVDLVEKTGSELHIVHAWHTIPLYIHPILEAVFDPHPYEQRARELLNTEIERIKEIGGTPEGEHLRMGPPADEIIELSEELGVELIVMGSRGLGPVERLTMGSVSEEVVHYATCPVLVVRGGEGAWPPARVVVGDDSSEGARKAGEVAANIGKLFGANTVLIRAYPEPPEMLKEEERNQDTSRVVADAIWGEERALEERAKELERSLGWFPQVEVAQGDAAALILEAVTEAEPTLIAVGSRGLGIMGRIRREDASRLGSVSMKVLRAAKGPVLVYRQG